VRNLHRAGAVALAAGLLVLGACSSSSSSNSSSSGSSLSGSSSDTASALDSAFTTVVANVGPSVVLIETGEGLGSGEVYDTNGDIVTNAHVVGNATSFRVTTTAGKQLPATLVGSFRPDDIAVIKVSNGSGLKPVTWGDSAKLKVGQPVLAIGNPLGLEGSATSGVVSALGRQVSEGAGGGTLPDAIQTSAPINPGNSGGALVDLESQVIGIPTLAALSPGAQGAQAPGIAFAISSDRARLIADQLVKTGTVTNSHRAYLGIQAGDTTQGKGVIVTAVQPGGPAAKAGIAVGDVITSVNGQQTPNTSTLSEVLAGLSPGQTVPVAIVRPDGGNATVRVTLGELPAG
jgi:putative serine protease PepD